MKNKICGILTLLMLVCFTLPAAAAKPAPFRGVDTQRATEIIKQAQQQDNPSRAMFRQILTEKEAQLKAKATNPDPINPLTDTLPGSVLRMVPSFYNYARFSVADILELYTAMCEAGGPDKIEELAKMKSYGEFYESHYPQVLVKEMEDLWPKLFPSGSQALMPKDRSFTYTYLQTYLIMWLLWEKEVRLEDM